MIAPNPLFINLDPGWGQSGGGVVRRALTTLSAFHLPVSIETRCGRHTTSPMAPVTIRIHPAAPDGTHAQSLHFASSQYVLPDMRTPRDHVIPGIAWDQLAELRACVHDILDTSTPETSALYDAVWHATGHVATRRHDPGAYKLHILGHALFFTGDPACPNASRPALPDPGTLQENGLVDTIDGQFPVLPIAILDFGQMSAHRNLIFRRRIGRIIAALSLEQGWT